MATLNNPPHLIEGVNLFANRGILGWGGYVQGWTQDNVLFVYDAPSDRVLFKVTREYIRMQASDSWLEPILGPLAKREGLDLQITPKTLKKIVEGELYVQVGNWAWNNPPEIDDTHIVMGSELRDTPLGSRSPIPDSENVFTYASAMRATISESGYTVSNNINWDEPF